MGIRGTSSVVVSRSLSPTKTKPGRKIVVGEGLKKEFVEVRKRITHQEGNKMDEPRIFIE